MTQDERLDYLLRYLLTERKEYADIQLPDGMAEKRHLLRSLMNVRPPVPASAEFLAVQDAYLQARLAERGVTRLQDMRSAQPGLYLWQGDITTLAVDAIVNAANSQMLGCFVPCHGCIDNAIHTYAGVQLRLECAEIMRKQGLTEGFDVGLEMSGSGAAFHQMVSVMRNGGKISLLGLGDGPISVDMNQIITKGLTLQGIYGHKMDNWHQMSYMVQGGLDLTPVITHRFHYTDFQKGFDAMLSGNSGKVVLDWTK